MELAHLVLVLKHLLMRMYGPELKLEAPSESRCGFASGHLKASVPHIIQLI